MTLLLLLAGCASFPDAGTSDSPEKPWTPPANAIPPQQSTQDIVMPPNVAAGATLSLAQIVDIALANNTQTRTAWLRARAAQAALGSSESAYLPDVDVTASLSRTQSVSPGNSAVRQTTLAPSIALSYLLFDFGGREAQVEQARATMIEADYLHNQAIQDVVLRAEQTYYGYLDAKALLAAQTATVKERQAQLDAADARHNAGVATIADVLQAKTALSQAQLTSETIEGNLRAIEGSLATVMGLPATAHFEFGDLPQDVPSQEIGQHVDELIAQAVAARPDLAAARADAQRARARIAEVRAQGLPAITLSSSVGHTFYNGGFDGTPYAASIGLRFPLFTGFRNTYDIREAEAQAAIANETARSVEQNINLQVWTSYFALQTAAHRLTTSRDLLASAQQSADVAQSRYRAGVGSILDLLTAESALENARAQEVQARADWFTAVAQLAHDTGKSESRNQKAEIE
jgi:TolC family type I secretion outer membrane protein